MINLFTTLSFALKSQTFGSLANVETVGLGLYLALGIIQVVSASGVAGLRRRTNTLLEAVKAVDIKSHQHGIVRIQAEISRLEISFEAINRTILRSTTLLFSLGLGYFSYCTLWPDQKLSCYTATAIFLYYLGLPLFIYGVSTIFISSRCKVARKQLWNEEIRFKRHLVR